MKKNAASQRTQFIMMFFAFAFGMILSNLLNTQSLKTEEHQNDGVLFIYRGIEKTEADIQDVDRRKINDINQQKIKAIETAALKQFFLDEARKQNIDVEEAALNILGWEPVSEEEVSAFYEKNKHKMNKKFYEVRPYIKRNMELQRASVARRNVLNELIEKGDLAILPSG